jgi:hypothetical protein
LLPDVIVIQLSLLVAVHVQLKGAVTETLPIPPDEVKLLLVGEIV